MSALLTVKGLSSGYGRVTALWDVSFDVEEGRIATLVGANGAGKTTTLRTISGLLPVAAGTITFDGRDLTRLRSDQIVDLGVVHVSEGSQLWPRLTVEENLELGAYLPRAAVRRAESFERVYALFPRLKERRRQKAGTLSGGERQMLAIGRALMSQPTVLMLDEPSLGLAPLIVRDIFGIISRLRADGVTILLVEQNARAALQVADHGYVLETGDLVLQGPAAELADDPRIVETYLGSKKETA